MIEKMKQIIAEQAELKDYNSITMETRLQEDLGLDSLDAIEILMALEEEFEIEVADEAFGNVKTFGDVVYYINEQLK